MPRKKLTNEQRSRIRSMVDQMLASPRFQPRGRSRKEQAFAIATSQERRRRRG